MGAYEKNFPVTWEELHRNAKALAWRLNSLGPFKGIISVTRGGLVPAAVVARELEIMLIDTICISSQEGDKQEELNVIKDVQLEEDGSGWLIIDDLVDTGDTARAVRKMLPKAHFATVYAKPAGRPLVDTYITEVSQDTWIFFPWDMEPQPVKPIASQSLILFLRNFLKIIGLKLKMDKSKIMRKYLLDVILNSGI